jgi:hypothetical protein
VQAPRNEFLAGAVLAENEHIRIGGRGPLNDREDLPHRFRFGDDVLAARS